MIPFTNLLKKWGATMGKSCWDCIHCDVCANIDGFSHHVSDVSKCKHFKGKADVEPVKHGEWKEITTHNGCTYDYDCVCSECRRGGHPFDNYCHNCGAKMEGKEVQE